MHRKRTSFHSFYMPNTKTKPKINKHQRIKPKITQIPTITTQKIQQNLPKKAQSDQHGNKKKKKPTPDLINRRRLHNLTGAVHQWWRRRRPARDVAGGRPPAVRINGQDRSISRRSIQRPRLAPNSRLLLPRDQPNPSPPPSNNSADGRVQKDCSPPSDRFLIGCFGPFDGLGRRGRWRLADVIVGPVSWLLLIGGVVRVR